MKFGLARIIASVALAVAGSSMASANLILDTFEGASAANYNVVNDGTPDGTVNFAFDYLTAGLPAAPRSGLLGGGGIGLRFTANDAVPAAVDAYTAFHITPINVPQYRLTVDVYMGFAGTGTTEYALVGVGGNGTATNRLGTGTTPTTGQSGSGSFFGFTGDGGAARDYLWYLDAANGGTGTVSAVAPNISSTYLAGGGGSELPLYNSIFPGGTPTTGGFPSNRWTTVDILVDQVAGQIEYSIGGTPIIRGPYTGSLDGRVSLGYADFFTSVAGTPGAVFGVFDNLQVTAVPEPSSIAFVGLGVLGIVARRRQLANRKIVS